MSETIENRVTVKRKKTTGESKTAKGKDDPLTPELRKYVEELRAGGVDLGELKRSHESGTAGRIWHGTWGG